MKISKVFPVIVFLNVFYANSQQVITSSLKRDYTEPRNMVNVSDSDDPILDFKKICGTIKGEYSVNENGAAVYSIPIIIPPGSGGMLPNVNIVYNSQSGDGYIGKGWTLSGFSSISRMAKTFYLDNKVEGLQFNNTDHFVLDGNVLIPINGNNGANGAEYRTEVETFSQIFSYCASGSNEPDYFIVHTKDGRIIEYGNTSNNTSNSRQYLPGLSKTLCWAVNKISDANTNYISFSYSNDNANGKFYPDKIEYTGNDNLPQLPYNTIKFVISNITPGKIFYLYGTKFSQNVRMNEIQIFNEGSLVRRYEFTYETDIKTMLKKITEFNRTGESYNPTIFNYTSKGVIDFGYWSPNLNIYTPGGAGFSWNEDHPREMADVNGDGMADIVGFGYSNVYVSLSNGQGYDPQQEWYHYDFCIASGWLTQNNNPETDETHPRHLVDVNGDGMADIVGFAKDGVYVALSNGNSFSQKSLWISYFCTNASAGAFLNETKHPRFLVDLNGDKLPDLVGFGNNGVKVAINTGSGFVLSPLWNMSFWGNIGSLTQNWIYPPYTIWMPPPNPEIHPENPNQLLRTMADVNGDGLADIVGFHQNNVYVSLSHGSYFDNPTPWISNNYCFGQSSGSWDVNTTPRYVQDVNGDGKSDIVGFYHDKVYVALSNGLNQFIPHGNWHDLFDTDYGYSSNKNDQFPRYLADINGDGLPDIVGFHHLGVIASLNTGASFEPVCSYITGEFGFDNDWGGFTTHIRTIADVNGDGRADIVGFGHDKVVTAFSRLDDDRKIDKITNGFGFRVGFSYQPIVNNSSVYHYTGHENYPFLKFAGSLKVVNAFSIENGIGGFNITNYEYQDAMAHLKGKGFLGFGKIIANNNDNINSIISTSIKDYSFDYNYCFKSLYNLQTRVNTNLTSTTIYSYDVYPNLNNSIIYFTGLCSTTSIDEILKNKLTKEFCFNPDKPPFSNYPGYDLWGNPQTILTTSTNLSNNTIDLIQTEEISYNSSGSWCDNKPVYIRTTKEKPGDPILNVREKAYVYDNLNGNMKNEISDPNDAKTTAIVFDDYDKFGNFRKKTLTTLSSNQLADITNTYEYDSKGRFLTKKINPLGHFLINKYETKFGNLLQTIDGNGIKTDYEYDDFGSLKKIINTSEGGSFIKYASEWITTTSPDIPSFAIYRTISTSSCDPNLPSVTIFDKLTRELQSENTNFNLKKIYTRKEYNNRGGVANVYLPYFDIANTLWSNIIYDEYGRKTIQTNPDASTVTAAYNGKETTVITQKNNSLPQQEVNSVNSLNQTTLSADNNGTIVEKNYFSSGLLKTTALGTISGTTVSIDQHTITSFDYDLQGNRLSITEPNSGTTTTSYNAYGQVIKQKDAKGNTTEMKYDLLGRITKKTITEGDIDYVYDVDPQSQQALPEYLGKISSVTANWSNGMVKDEFYYNILGRESKTVEIVDGIQYEEKKVYDDCGRLDKLTYPDDFVIQHIYQNGQLYQLRDFEANKLIWQADREDNFGNITRFSLGNGVITTKLFENTTGRLTDIKTDKLSYHIQDWNYTYDDAGNINFRTDNIPNPAQSESFEYSDHLNRLNKIINNNSTSVYDIIYDKYGNITQKDGVGNYAYDVNQINAVREIINNPGNISKVQDITYTSFNKVMHISEDNGHNQIDFIYGPDFSRRKTYYYDNTNQSISKYFAFGNYEVENQTAGLIRDHYIYAVDGLAAIYRYTEVNNTSKMYYIHKDHLGSFDRVSDEDGTMVDAYSFDAWGNRRDVNDWEQTDATTHLLARGYTGHEHLDKFGIINMNGRLYDPLLGRFLSPDNYVQAPNNTQNFNRYSYCLNNPMLYTDPSGELFGIDDAIIMGSIALFSYLGGTAANNGQINPIKWDWKSDNTWYGLGIGAVAGGFGGWSLAAGGQALAGTAFFGSFANGTIVAYGIAGTLSFGAAGYATGFGTGMVVSHGDWDYANKLGGFYSAIGASVGSIVGTALGFSEQAKKFMYQQPQVTRSSIAYSNSIAHIDGGSNRSTFSSLPNNQSLFFDGTTLELRQNYYDGSYTNVDSWAALSGPWGKGKLPSGTYIGDNLRKVTTPLGMVRDGVGFNFNLTPQFNTTRSAFRIHPDGGVFGTLGCIGLQVRKAELNNFYNSINKYLIRDNPQINVIVQY
ncbi:MAG: toxin TcdB middle/N-terminal domain-containing protein [Bacteroidales bacterium]